MMASVDVEQVLGLVEWRSFNLIVVSFPCEMKSTSSSFFMMSRIAGQQQTL